MTNGRMQFESSFGRVSAPGSVGEQPFRILVLGNITGRESGQHATPLAQRKPLQVDVDNLQQVFARLAPRVDLTLEGARLAIEFERFDDFHPDRLFQRLAPFASLRELRAELMDPSRFRRAAAALRAQPSADAHPIPSEADSDIERLLGRKPEAEPPSAPGVVALDHWLKSLVAPYVLADTAHEQQQFIAAVDAATAEQMRRVLHHPAFQALEANWRGIARLATELETGERVQVFLLDAPREDLVEDMGAAGDDPKRSGLYRHVCGPETDTPDGERWSLIVGDYAFSPGVEDVRLLAALGALAAQAGASLLAGARTEVLGSARIERLSEPESWLPLDPEAEARWSALRASAGAPWIGLALPRVLARLPYGAKTDPIESFEFEELGASRDHEAYLWSNPAFALALLAGQAFQERGWAMDLDCRLDIADLPSHTYQEDGEAKLQPCAEVLFSGSTGEIILAHGIMPLMSYRNRNAARLLRWQSLANPAQALRGAWTDGGLRV
jgi:type VI secretion system protein ImpC